MRLQTAVTDMYFTSSTCQTVSGAWTGRTGTASEPLNEAVNVQTDRQTDRQIDRQIDR